MPYDVLFACSFFVFGILIGSFLNVCIFRIPKKETIVSGHSHCMSCNKQIKWYDLIPVLSFLILRGKCRYCGEKLSPRYPIIEALNGIAYLLIYLLFGLTPYGIGCCLLFSVLVVVSMIDLDTGEIPDRLHICILVLSPLFFFDQNTWWEHLIGFAAASLILLLLAILTNGFGGGDIKLMAVCGLCLSWKLILLALFFGVIIGGIAGAFVLLKKRGETTKKVHTMPFGPALSIGVMLAALFGEKLLSLYFGMFL